MDSLVLSAATFTALHLLVAGTRVRDALVARLGEAPYRGVFSLASAVALGWLIWSYGVATDPQVGAGSAHRWIGAVLMAPALAFIVLGLLTPGPTLAGAERLLLKAAPARGIHRVTRHPFLWGVALWAAVHLAYNTRPADLLFFATFLVIAVIGTFSIDAKRARRFGEAWARYGRETSNIPFAAILAGRNRMAWREFGAWRLLAVVLAYALVGAMHARLFGVAPF